MKSLLKNVCQFGHPQRLSKDESKILIIFVYLLLLVLEETFDKNVLFISNILKIIYIIMTFRSQLNEHWIFISEISLILSINYYTGQSKSDSLILLILFTNITSNTSNKPRLRRLFIFIIHSVCFTIILSIFNTMYTKKHPSFFSFKMISSLSEIEIVLSFFFMNIKEKEVNALFKEANIGIAIIKNNIINNPSEGVTLFFANNKANEYFIKEQTKESCNANTLPLINQIKKDIVIDGRIIDNTYVSKEHKYSVNAVASPTFTLMTIEKSTFERENIKNKIFRDVKLQILISFLHNLNNPINGLLVYSQRCIELLKEMNSQLHDQYQYQSIIDNLKYNKFHIKIFNRNISFYSKLLLNESVNLSFNNINLMNIIKKEIERYELFYQIRRSRLDHDIKITPNVTIFSDCNKFRYLLKNIFLYILRKREYEKVLFKAEFFDLDQTKVRLVFRMENHVGTITEEIIESRYKTEDIYRIEKNAQEMEMLNELIVKLAELLHIPIQIHTNSIVIECDCSLTSNCYDDNDLNMFEFSPQTDNQNIQRRLILMRSLPSFNIRPKTTRNRDSELKISLKQYIDVNTTQSPIYTLNDETKSCLGDNSIDDDGINRINRPNNKINLLSLSASCCQIQESWHNGNNTNRSDGNFNINIHNKFSEPILKNILMPLAEIDNAKDNNISNYNIRSQLPSQSQKPKCNCKEILIIDDEEFIISTIKSIICKEFNVNSDESTNGIEAMKKIKHNMTKNCCLIKYRLLFVDINMPLMGGYSVCNELQKLFPEGYDLSIIVISSYSNISDVQSVLRKNPFVKDFSKKPLKKSVIIKFVNQYYIDTTISGNILENDN